jgi:hypothetical protein
MGKIKIKAITDSLDRIIKLQVRLDKLHNLGVTIEGLDTTDVLINTTAVLVIHPNSLTDELHNKVIDAICEWVYEVTEEIPISHSEVFARLLLAEYEYA